MIDLKALAGDRYKITLDESAELDPSWEGRLWYYQIPGRRAGSKHSLISVHGKDTLAAWSDRYSIVRKLESLPGVTVHQRGDHEIRVLFPPSRLDEVAEVIEARRRRRMSEATKAKVLPNLKPFPSGWRSKSTAS